MQDGRVMMLEPPGEDDEMDLMQHGREGTCANYLLSLHFTHLVSSVVSFT